MCLVVLVLYIGTQAADIDALGHATAHLIGFHVRHFLAQVPEAPPRTTHQCHGACLTGLQSFKHAEFRFYAFVDIRVVAILIRLQIIRHDHVKVATCLGGIQTRSLHGGIGCIHTPLQRPFFLLPFCL